ncbi:hypothetical protein C6Y40_09675 [Alteromonas alba]|uniref:Uncharacterized protein n=1 Tax=Alteromonas alba TaxID=2079529 RepID=A0A2S9VB23_9ALTE|nr:hypothetical protein [Alteromonas alba]PRO73669.1 hypothetical protein C6Y40_09675 [Alteromonas alba]
MEIGQSPVDSAYSRPTPTPAERNEAPRQERLESNQNDAPAPVTQSGSQPTATTGSVGRNIDTYA